MQLSLQLQLLIVPGDKKLRLVITDGINELACRKETAGNLRRFLVSPQTQLFKGRLQLRNLGEVLAVILKGEQVGAISREDFEKELSG